MSAHTEKTSRSTENRTQTAEASAKGTEEVLGIPDQRPEQTVQRKLQRLADGSVAPVQRTENRTGLPDNLKSGIENLSGYSMDDVKVHYNSDKPADLQAHAFAQGSDIHVAPGQEKHLPHEAWHVVQQKQGRVRATRQLKGTTPVNDDDGLEKEADEMGTKASSGLKAAGGTVQKKPVTAGKPVVQRKIKVGTTELTTVDEVITLITDAVANDGLTTNPVAKRNYAAVVTEMLNSAEANDIAANKPIRHVGPLARKINRLINATYAAEEAELTTAFSAVHKVISFRALTLYYLSPKWYLSAIQEFDDGTRAARNYGVCFSICKKSDPSKKMYTHFHVHHNDSYSTINAHFKSGRSKTAPQSWDIARSQNLIDWVKYFRNHVTSEATWTEF